MGPKINYSKWSEEELQRAEREADRFLNENEGQIRENLEAKLALLGRLVRSLNGQPVSLDERLDCFARIAEAAGALEEDAKGFFSLASEPIVARLLRRAEARRQP
jgi:exonuclease VII small subunit